METEMSRTEVVKFPAWLTVLRHWQMVEYRNALTLPSLIGVERYVSDMRGASARDDLRAVLGTIVPTGTCRSLSDLPLPERADAGAHGGSTLSTVT